LKILYIINAASRRHIPRWRSASASWRMAEVARVPLARVPSMYSVYAIFNTKHKKIYIGQSKDLDNRLKLHQERTFKNSYTSQFDGKWTLIHKEDFETRKEAIIRERQLKSYRGREFIRRLADQK